MMPHAWPLLITELVTSCTVTVTNTHVVVCKLVWCSLSGCVEQGLKQQCASEVQSVQQELQHKQRQAARILKAKAEEEAIRVSLYIWSMPCLPSL